MSITKALLIGINYKGTDNSLRGCYNDVVTMGTFLESQYGVQQVMILTDEHEDYNKPTRKHIIQAIAWLTNGAKKGDCLFFHYSGHGSQVKVVDDVYEKDRMDETICPLDFKTEGMITDGELKYHLVDALPAGCKMTCILDCCHSGTGLDLKYIMVNDKNTNNNPINDSNFSKNFVNKFIKLNEFYLDDCGYADNNADVVMISGCMSTQTSADAVIDKQSCGAMTYSFVKTMKDSIFSHSRLTYVTLMNNMLSSLRGKYEQIPQIHFSKNIDIYDYFEMDKPTKYDHPSINHLMPKEFVRYDNDASINVDMFTTSSSKPQNQTYTYPTSNSNNSYIYSNNNPIYGSYSNHSYGGTQYTYSKPQTKSNELPVNLNLPVKINIDEKPIELTNEQPIKLNPNEKINIISNDKLNSDFKLSSDDNKFTSNNEIQIISDNAKPFKSTTVITTISYSY